MHLPDRLAKVQDSIRHMASSPKEKVTVRPKLSAWFPNTESPVIISAPMLGVSNGTLAANVSKAGGFGMVPGGFDFSPSSTQLTTLGKELAVARQLLDLADRPLTPIPVGVGFILCHPSISQFEKTALPLLQEHSPQAVWLFAPPPPPNSPNPDAATHPAYSIPQGVVKDIIEMLHRSGFVVMFQVGTVAAARQAVNDGADIIVAQGVDAGGHQYASGSGVISLVPEIETMLETEFAERAGEVVVVAAGGIVDGRGVAAALALGAEGAVMGTRFIPSPESSMPEFKKQMIINTNDGGVNTAKSTFHDEIQGTTFWPTFYDGRAIITDSYRDHSTGLSLEENRQKFKEAQEKGETGRVVTWAGTGVGLVKDSKPAGDIVREAREISKQRIKALQQSIV
ncbi:FMN-dependent 2-nitropropane dioxygenase [Diplogelasinospora grovesii]|uniref:FMN-dependent 2-nitropropane dioxygenase n=1 Tax=Diplogelasinospora grovesii TaxID=303347 RepID=A0AAN6S1P6_9PEZI|nr:FMN-dependent 2-nitropropane dioxygenase [Diplogelasinospora grovesii]